MCGICGEMSFDGRPVSEADLPMVRGLHLVAVQKSTGRADYAAGTDGDLLT